MIKNSNDEIPSIEVPTGEQTQISKKIIELSKQIEGEGIDYIKNVSDYIRSLDTKETHKFTSERDATEIIDSGYWSGCHEAGIVFASLLRAKGINTIYIQVLNREGVENYKEGESSLNGHVYLEAEIGGSKVIINSTNGKITDKLPEDVVIGAKGMDSWDIGLKEHQDMRNIFKARHSDFLA